MNPACEAALRELGDGEQADQLREELKHAPAGKGMRAGMLEGIVDLLDDHPARADYEAFARHFPRRLAFSMMPIDELMLCATRIATWLEPELSWVEATNRVIERSTIEGARDINPILRPMLQLCERDVGEFLRIMVTGQAAVLNAARLELETLGRFHQRLHVYSPCARALRRGFPGGVRGLIGVLGCSGEVAVITADDDFGHLEIDVQWTLG